jgi:hypothetical protein
MSLTRRHQSGVSSRTDALSATHGGPAAEAPVRSTLVAEMRWPVVGGNPDRPASQTEAPASKGRPASGKRVSSGPPDERLLQAVERSVVTVARREKEASPSPGVGLLLVCSAGVLDAGACLQRDPETVDGSLMLYLCIGKAPG